MHELESARALLPFWVVWGPLLLYVPLAFLLSLAGTWAGVAMSLRLPASGSTVSWMERARLVYPGRAGAARSCLLCPLLFGTFALPFFLGGVLTPVPPALVSVLAAVAAYLGATVVRYRVNRPFRPLTPGLGSWVRGELVAWLVFSGWRMILGGVAAGLYGRSGLSPWVVLGLGGLALGFFCLGGGILLARVLRLARPASARLQAVVTQAATQVGVHPRGVYEADLNDANALAFPLVGRLAFSPALLAVLDDEELRAVCVHELGHLAEPPLLALTRVLPLLFMLPVVGCGPLIEYGGMTAFAAAAAAAMLALLLAPPLSRLLEWRADALARTQESEAGTYARALIRIAEANLAPVVGEGRGGTHPHLYDRLLAAGVQPEYPRPRPPSRIRMLLGRGFAAVLALVLIETLLIGRLCFPDSEPLALASLALGGGWPSDLGILAHGRVLRGEPESAVVLFGAEAEADPRAPEGPAHQAMVLAEIGRCPEAIRAAREALRRFLDLGSPPHRERIVRWAWSAARECDEDP
jgi:Zn-dependent protease with chaperone function